jgi:hypothetical protein
MSFVSDAGLFESIRTSAPVRCLTGESSTVVCRIQLALYVMLAVATVFGSRKTAAMTQGAEASLLVAAYDPSRVLALESTPHLDDERAGTGTPLQVRESFGGLGKQEAALDAAVGRHGTRASVGSKRRHVGAGALLDRTLEARR